MRKRIMERNWWLASGMVALLVVRLFEPFKSNFLLTLLAALVVGAFTLFLMAVVPKSSQ